MPPGALCFSGGSAPKRQDIQNERAFLWKNMKLHQKKLLQFDATVLIMDTIYNDTGLVGANLN